MCSFYAHVLCQLKEASIGVIEVIQGRWPINMTDERERKSHVSIHQG